MSNKQIKITEKEQRAAADILIAYFFEEDKDKWVKWVNDTYELMTDPFTQLPCSSKEYEKNNVEYNRQTMMQKYGYCDGLE